LVRGADRFNECIVSWGLVKGTGKKVVGQTQHLRTDFNKANVCLRGRIYRDSKTCQPGMMAGSNVTFILKDPMGQLHYEVIDACREPIDRPHDFKVCPKKKVEYADVEDQSCVNCATGKSNEFSIKNNCKTPYCSKVITGWSSYGYEQDFTTLASISIHKDLFDPIIDPDLIEYNVAKNDESEGMPAEQLTQEAGPK